jgi:hypothetical protein
MPKIVNHIPSRVSSVWILRTPVRIELDWHSKGTIYDYRIEDEYMSTYTIQAPGLRNAQRNASSRCLLCITARTIFHSCQNGRKRMPPRRAEGARTCSMFFQPRAEFSEISQPILALRLLC